MESTKLAVMGNTSSHESPMLQTNFLNSTLFRGHVTWVMPKVIRLINWNSNPLNIFPSRNLPSLAHLDKKWEIRVHELSCLAWIRMSRPCSSLQNHEIWHMDHLPAIPSALLQRQRNWCWILHRYVLDNPGNLIVSMTARERVRIKFFILKFRVKLAPLLALLKEVVARKWCASQRVVSLLPVPSII